MADKSEVSVLLTLKDQMTKEMDKAKANILASLKTMGVAFTAYSAAMSAAIVMAIKDAQNYAAALDKVSKTSGISTEELSKLGYAAKQEHASMETLAGGLKYLSKNMNDMSQGMGEAKRSFETLGIKVTDSDGKLRNTGDVLLEIADKFKGMENETQKTALAMEIFGRSGVELVPFLNMGREEIIRLGNEAKRLGIVLTKDNVAAFKKFEDSQDAIKAGWLGMKISLANELLPALQSLAKMFQKLIEWVISWSDSTKTIIAVSITLTTVLSGMVGVTALIIGNLPKIAAGWKLVKVAVNSTFFAYTALVVVLAVAQKLILDYLEKQQEERIALIETGKSLQSLITLHQQELIEIKEKLKNVNLSIEAREKLELQYIRTKKAIKDTISEIGKETKATVEQKKAIRNLDDEMTKWQNSLGDVSYEQLPDLIKALEKTNDELSEAEKRLRANQASLSGAGQGNKQYTDGLKIMETGLKGTKKMSEENAAAFITMASTIFNSGATLQNTFSTVVDGVSRMFDPVTGAAIQLGGSIVKKLFWGKKESPEVIDENLRIIEGYLASIKFMYGNFAVDVIKIISDALQMPSIEEGLSNVFAKVKAKFQTEFANLISGQMMQTPEYQERMRNIGNIMSLLSTGVSYTPGGVGMGGQPIAPTGTQLVNPYTGQVEFVQTMERLREIFLAGEIAGLKNFLAQSYSGMSGAYSELSALTNIFDIPAAAEGLTVRPRAGGTLVRVGEAGETEHIIPESKMGGLVVNINAGTLVGDRVSIAKLVREYLVPELTRYKLKTGEAF